MKKYYKCGNKVNGKKKFSIIGFILFVPFYLVYYIFIKKEKCEVCGSRLD